jgi:hypothetical protein
MLGKILVITGSEYTDNNGACDCTVKEMGLLSDTETKQLPTDDSRSTTNVNVVEFKMEQGTFEPWPWCDKFWTMLASQI